MKVRDAKTEYEDYLENTNESAPNTVINTYRAIGTALDDYIAELSEFQWVCGFNHALRLMGKEVPNE